MPNLNRPAALMSRALMLGSMVLAAPLTLPSASAADAVWLSTATVAGANAGTFDLYAGANWVGGTAPTGTATFGASTTSNLYFATSGVTFDGWTFGTDAVAYAVANAQMLNFTGAGIVVIGGSVTIDNGPAGVVIFSNASSAGTAVINNTGGQFIQFEGTASAGSATITNTVGDIYFRGSSTASTATISSAGSLRFYDSASAAGATIVNNATLEFNESSTGGTASIANNGLLRLRNNSTLGNAALTNGASGVVDVSSSTGTNGDGKLSAGSIAGGGLFYLGNKELTVGSDNRSTTVSGVISDCGASGTACAGGQFHFPWDPPMTGGSLVKTGTGTLSLSGVNTYTGATIVDAGTLAVNGNITSSSGVTVNSGGTLGGTGTVGTTTINGGTLAPGNSVGALTVQGDLVFTSASRYMVEVSPSNAGRVDVSGTATLAGATVAASFASGSYVAKQYTILSAVSGVVGTFSGATTTNLPANFSSSLVYDAGHAYLKLTLNYVPAPAPDPTPGSAPAPTYAALTGNQQGVGTALTGFFNRTGGIPLVFGALTAEGLTQASGPLAATPQQTGTTTMTQFTAVLTDPFSAGRGGNGGGGAIGFADEDDAGTPTGGKGSGAARDAFAMITKAPPRAPTFEARWSVWASGFGGAQTTDGNATAGTSTTSSSFAGVAVGADYRMAPQTTFGFAMAGGATRFSVAGSLGSGRSDLFQIGGFVRHEVGTGYVTASTAYGWQEVFTDRTVILAGLDQLHAQFHTNSYSGRIEGGNRYVTPVLGGIGITPYAAAQVTAFVLPSYAESVVSGASTFALSYAGKTTVATRSELGLRSDKSFAVNGALLILRGRAAWAHDYNTDASASATFQSLPGASFVVNGALPAHDAALTTAAAELQFASGISLAGTFEGEFSQVTRSYSGKGTARYEW